MKRFILTYCCILFFSTVGFSQVVKNDSAARIDSLSLQKGFSHRISTATVINNAAAVDTIAITTESTAFKPDPMKAVWLGAIIPGGGQIYNRKYWLLPIVYGGFLGFAYAINWNNNQYTSYKRAYIDATDNDKTTNYHIKILPPGYTVDTYGGLTTYSNKLKSAMNQYRQYRDLSILLSIGYYALVLLQAYVDAQLYDFDISPDLALSVAPTRIDFGKNAKSGFGLQCSIRF